MNKFFSAKLIALYLLGALLVSACLWLSHWQWERAHISRKAAQPNQVVDFTKLSKPKDFLPPTSVGQKTRVTGTWESGRTVLFPNRAADGRTLLERESDFAQSGLWVVNFLDLKDGTSVAVVRGWIENSAQAKSVSGVADVIGVVQPSEDAPYPTTVQSKPLLTTNFLLERTNSNLRDGFIIESGSSAPYQQVIPTRSPNSSDSLRPLNMFYTFNWIFFALFVIAIWRRIILDEVSSATVSAESSKLDT